ncbi:MAG TPA: quinone-dependent dihydroorotate dehydrogenase [Burkholderiales bacterium]|nr:quinone-dependent dihydroorotate dehydrogenase [Burkholderiales bacterium]
MSYALMRPALFALEAETAHHLTLSSLKALQRIGLVRPSAIDTAQCSSTVMGIRFPNAVGLAAGLDKNGAYIDALAALGFGHIEIGTVTPRPQPGNPRPRLFRIAEADAIVNRMGFNNEGVDRVIANVHRSTWRGVLGINIGKNFDTPLEHALNDYLACLRKVYALATYVTVNISSPNTKGLRDLQAAHQLDALLAGIAVERRTLSDQYGRRVPLALKIAPDLDESEIDAIARLVEKHSVDAVIATNTTVARDGVATLAHGHESGGLSGAPLRAKATRVVASLARALAGAIPVIGVGGILTGADAREKFDAGASLVQLYTGLIYKGPALVAECVSALCPSAADRHAT